MQYFLFKLFLYLSLLFINLVTTFYLAPFIIDFPHQHSMGNYTWQIVIYLFTYYIHHLLTRRMATINEFILVLKSNIIGIISVFFVVSVTKGGEETSRAILLLFFTLNMFIPVWSYLLKRRVLLLPFFRSKVYVICDSKGLENINKWFARNNPFGYDIDAVFNVDEEPLTVIEKKLDTIIQDQGYTDAVIDIEYSEAYDVNHLVDYIQRNTHRVIIMPNMAKFPMLNGELLNSNYYKGTAFFIKNNLLSSVDQRLKFVFEIFLTIMLIVLFLPLLVLLYTLVFISTKGHPLFKQERIGCHGKRFMIYKFRSMHLDAKEKLEHILSSCPVSKEEWENDFKLKNDPRITRVGNFLRKTSLDELPQLINVLRGEMALVGPRPIVEEEIKKYGEYFEYFTAVKPGITGLWQVSGRNDIEYDERVQLDVWYTRNWSMELDIKILFQTIAVVLLRKGSY